MLIVGTLCQIIEQIHPKTGNPLVIVLVSICFINIIFTNASNKYYHEIVSDYLSEQHKRELVSVALRECCISSWISYGLKRGIILQIVFGLSLCLSILCLTNDSEEYFSGTGPA